jgi:hypothetical protein
VIWYSFGVSNDLTGVEIGLSRAFQDNKQCHWLCQEPVCYFLQPMLLNNNKKLSILVIMMKLVLKDGTYCHIWFIRMISLSPTTLCGIFCLLSVILLRSITRILELLVFIHRRHFGLVVSLYNSYIINLVTKDEDLHRTKLFAESSD